MTARALFAAALLAGIAHADTIDDTIRRSMAAQKTPGAAVVVLRKGVVVKSAAYGLADLERPVPMTTSTLFQLASASKPFAAVAVALLADDGKLSFDQPVGELLPDLPEAWRGITVRRLLDHTSGLPDVFSDVATGTMRAEGRDALLKALYETPVLEPPGTSWRYDQTGYLVAQRIVESLSGVGYEEFVAKRIFARAGMTRAGFGDYYDVVLKRASYYKARPDGSLRHYLFAFPQYLRTAAGVNATAPEVGRFLRAVFDGGLVSSVARDAMLAPATLADGTTHEYACGWVVYSVSGVRGYGHSGGGSSAFGVFPDKHLAVVVLTNQNGSGVEELFEAVARAAIARPGG